MNLISRVFYLSILIGLASVPSVMAEVVPDGTLSTQITSSDRQNFTIENGDRVGNNLFHSFLEFSVPTNGSAVFNNAVTIENIFGRVTGSDISNIDGLIQTNGTANIFLLNPNGIVFGENASLDIGGSFVASTAERILFSDAVEFSASDGVMPPLLTVSTPVGLGLGVQPGEITVTGPSHGLTLDFNTANTAEPVRDNRPVGLQVNTGETLALIGGEILVEGGNLTANQGRIELGSVAQAGEVALIPTSDGFTVDYSAIDRFGDLRFTQAASVDVSGEGSGNVHFQGGNLAVSEGSAIISNVLGADDGGDVTVRASGLLDIQGGELENFPSAFFLQGDLGSTGQLGNLFFDVKTLRIEGGGRISGQVLGQGDGSSIAIQANTIELSGVSPDGFISSGIFASVGLGGEGNAASISFSNVDILRITDGAEIVSSTFGSGDGGPIAIQANTIDISGRSPDDLFRSGIFADVVPRSEGNAGSIKLFDVDILRVTDGARIVSSTFGSGDGGPITIQASTIELSNGGIFANALAPPGFEGNAGSIELSNVDILRLTDGAQIGNGTVGLGDGGPITIQANTIEISGMSPDGRFGSGIFSTARFGSEGNAGSIELSDVNSLRVTDGAQIVSATFGSGDGGPIAIQANTIEISGVSPDGRFGSGIFADVAPGGEGNAGSIELSDVNSLRVTDGARIINGTFGTGNGGPIIIQANNIELSGTSPDGRFISGIFADVVPGAEGNAGSIDIMAERLQVTENAVINVSSLGEGNASDLTIAADQVLLTQGGALTAEVSAGEQGNIFLTANSLLFLRGDATISANATNQATGGNIMIAAPIILGLDNSDIIANAVEASGGNIDITTQGLLGLQFRDFRTPESDITASSEFGRSGTVAITELNPNILQDTSELPVETSPPALAQGCRAYGGDQISRFVRTGRGGLPTNPLDTLSDTTIWQDISPLEANLDSLSASSLTSGEEANPITQAPNHSLMEAQQWTRDATGTVILTAQAAVPHPVGQQLGCS